MLILMRERKKYVFRCQHFPICFPLQIFYFLFSFYFCYFFSNEKVGVKNVFIDTIEINTYTRTGELRIFSSKFLTKALKDKNFNSCQIIFFFKINVLRIWSNEIFALKQTLVIFYFQRIDEHLLRMCRYISIQNFGIDKSEAFTPMNNFCFILKPKLKTRCLQLYFLFIPVTLKKKILTVCLY